MESACCHLFNESVPLLPCIRFIPTGEPLMLRECLQSDPYAAMGLLVQHLSRLNRGAIPLPCRIISPSASLVHERSVTQLREGK